MPKKILLDSATPAEMMKTQDSNFESLVTGVGMVATTFALTQKLTESHFDLIIDLGIAGSFNPAFGIGSVVQIIADRFSELGVEDNGRFIPADEMKLTKKEDVFFKTEIRVNSLSEAHGITVGLGIMPGNGNLTIGTPPLPSPGRAARSAVRSC